MSRALVTRAAVTAFRPALADTVEDDMDDAQQARERGGRLDELPEHEDDADVAADLGGGIMGTGGTSEVRGTGEMGGNAQGLDDEATDARAGDTGAASPGDETPGILAFTDERWEPGDGGGGRGS